MIVTLSPLMKPSHTRLACTISTAQPKRVNQTQRAKPPAAHATAKTVETPRQRCAPPLAGVGIKVRGVEARPVAFAPATRRIRRRLAAATNRTTHPASNRIAPASARNAPASAYQPPLPPRQKPASRREPIQPHADAQARPLRVARRPNPFARPEPQLNPASAGIPATPPWNAIDRSEIFRNRPPRNRRRNATRSVHWRGRQRSSVAAPAHVLLAVRDPVPDPGDQPPVGIELVDRVAIGE